MSLVDIGRGICRSMGSTLIMSSIFIPAERECSINIISFLMYGESDDARQLQGFRQFFIRTENSHHKKFLFEWCCNSCTYDDFLTIKVKLKLIDEHVTVMVLYLDKTYSFSNSQNFEFPIISLAIHYLFRE